MESNNTLPIDNMRIEIATLTEDIKSNNNKPGKFRIEAIMTKNDTGKVYVSNNNIRNSNTANLKSSSINLNNFIELDIPSCFRILYGKNKIPKGTRFLVGFTGANLNDARIVGLYDTEVYGEYLYNHKQVENKIGEIIDKVNEICGHISSLYGMHEASVSLSRLTKQAKEVK